MVPDNNDDVFDRDSEVEEEEDEEGVVADSKQVRVSGLGFGGSAELHDATLNVAHGQAAIDHTCLKSHLCVAHCTPDAGPPNSCTLHPDIGRRLCVARCRCGCQPP